MSKPEKGSACGAPHAGDQAWDRFLEWCPRGQFQQSSRWADVKALEGWNTQRILIDPSNIQKGGLQILWRRTRFGRVGYVSKGPVLPVEDPEVVDEVLTRLRRSALALSLRAVILQPPDESAIGADVLLRHGFGHDPVESVIRATAMVDLAGGREGIVSRLHRKARQQTRAAKLRGVSVRLGTRSDLPLFFELMLGSCRRQGSKPNPARLELLQALWDRFQPSIWLGLAAVGGESVAGLLMVGHGARLTFWKKGWNALEARSYANCLLNAEALNWSVEWGYRVVDFAGINFRCAERLIAGGVVESGPETRRDFFNLRLGATPRLLPPARLWVQNPLLRHILAWARRFPPFERILMRTS